jgi:hypothetical protein
MQPEGFGDRIDIGAERHQCRQLAARQNKKW